MRCVHVVARKKKKKKKEIVDEDDDDVTVEPALMMLEFKYLLRYRNQT